MQNYEFKYCLLNDKYFRQAADCLTKVFSTNEPMGKHLKITEGELIRFVEKLLMHAFSQNLSWIAIDNSSQKIAAVRILTDFHNDFEFEPSSEKLKTIFELLHSLYKNHEFELHVSKNTVLHTWMTAVYPNYQKKGLLKNLYKIGSHHAKVKGFTYCIGEATNIHNLNFLIKEANCQILNKIEYKKFKFNEIFPFANIEEHSHCSLYKYNLLKYPEVYSSVSL